MGDDANNGQAGGAAMKAFWTIRDFARVFGSDPSNARRWLSHQSKQLGYDPRNTKYRPVRGQDVLAWTREQAEVLLAERRRQGYPVHEHAPGPGPEAGAAGTAELVWKVRQLLDELEHAVATANRNRGEEA